MPAERVAMRQAREIIRLKFSAGLPTREIARRLGVAASTVRGTLRRFEGAGMSWPLPVGMSDGDLEAALYANHRTRRAGLADSTRAVPVSSKQSANSNDSSASHYAARRQCRITAPSSR